MTDQIHAAFRVDVAAPLRSQYGLDETQPRVCAVIELPHPDDYAVWMQTIAERHVMLSGPDVRPPHGPMGRNWGRITNQEILRWTGGSPVGGWGLRGTPEGNYLRAFASVKAALDREKRARTRGAEFNAQAVKHLYGAARLIADSRLWMEESERQARLRTQMVTEHPL